MKIDLKPQNNKGFTLIEIILVISILAILAGIGAPIYYSFQNRNELDIASFELVVALRRAQLLSQSVSGDEQWGVDVGDEFITLFKGSNFSSRDSSFDEIFGLANSVSSSGISEIIFSKLTGEPNTTGNIVFTSTNSEVRTITINSKGTINY